MMVFIILLVALSGLSLLRSPLLDAEWRPDYPGVIVGCVVPIGLLVSLLWCVRVQIWGYVSLSASGDELQVAQGLFRTRRLPLADVVTVDAKRFSVVCIAVTGTVVTAPALFAQELPLPAREA
ncbi:MAG: hypothetical protein ACOCXA_02320 [Planctomycetota bacterium]